MKIILKGMLFFASTLLFWGCTNQSASKNDTSQLYIEALEELMRTDDALNHEMAYIAIDMEQFVEVDEEQKEEIKQYFAVYDSWEASLKAHAELLAHGTEAKPNVFKDVLKTKNYQEAAWALQKDGYATDPNYANELIYAIKKFKLYKYDQ